MARTPSPSSTARLGKAVAVLLLVLGTMARGFPLEGPQLDSAVEGVQKYLESSGFPKMTRGEVLDFLNEFSRSSRVSRSDNTADPGKSPRDNAVTPPQPDYGFTTSTSSAAKSAAATTAKSKTSSSAAKTVPVYESPLAYGYPLSSKTQTDRVTMTTTTAAPAVTTPTIFVTAPGPIAGDDGKKNEIAKLVIGGRNGSQKKSVVPSVDLNAYTKFKKIPEARDLKIDDDMRVFLGGFGLLQPSSPKSGKSIEMGAAVNGTAQRRADLGVTDIDDVDIATAAADTVDQRLLESVLAETGNGQVNASQLLDRVSSTRDHVFNPSDSNVKTVDVNRIAKIVENIRLLTDGDNGTVPLPPDFIQKKIENITASIADIDKPAGTATAGDAKAFNGYEVFFDDDSKEIDSDLPESPAADAPAGSQIDDESPLDKAIDQPDPLSTDELQQLLEKTKTDVKRQEPKDETVATSTAAATTVQPVSVTSTVAATTAAATADSSSEATSAVEVTSDGGDAARGSSSQSAADASPSLSQLAESFGGGETASEPPTLTDLAEVPANRPRNGLYFYVDWNSFLTVNEGQKNQVNLRFAPKAGNPAHFLRVAVP